MLAVCPQRRAAFGILGHAWERSPCVFGVGAITHVAVEHQFTNRGADRVIVINMRSRDMKSSPMTACS
jgi:hypothetical protein